MPYLGQQIGGRSRLLPGLPGRLAPCGNFYSRRREREQTHQGLGRDHHPVGSRPFFHASTGDSRSAAASHPRIRRGASHAGHRSANPPKFIFVGRNSPEKGLAELLEIWPQDLQLDVVGTDGAVSANRDGHARVRYLGVQGRAWIAEQLPTYTALVFPGRVWEGAYPLVVREALEAGVPVVALAESGAADLIHECNAGATYEDGSESHLRNAVEAIIEGGQQLRLRAREAFKKMLTEDMWLAQVRVAYGHALASTVSS